ncbi:hypothetical protein BDN72DRAFT_846116 [Pluteus cervinus]|uniref:Uncharacterized protein n=1 Tax=Pluteus cervinus TaxID=181527 RepID=A0ACD3AHD6_9AGAR|nr:hypothetical protein BDN72DRAFT_846116 [Pluteus cervinus]
MSDPIFPPELESIIFATALALKDTGESALNLILVAKRVLSWLVPELMRTLAVQTTVSDPVYYRRCNLHMLKQYGAHTRELLLWKDSDDNEGIRPDQYVSLCPNITNLLLWTGIDNAQIDAIAHLPLMHLSVNLKELIRTNRTSLSSLFSKITHLDLVNIMRQESEIVELKAFSSLTHLAVLESTPWGLLAMLFEHLSTLKVVVYLDSNCDELGVADRFDILDDDLRVVQMTCRADMAVEEWLLDVQQGLGLWGMADNAVLAQKELQKAHRNKMANGSRRRA